MISSVLFSTESSERKLFNSLMCIRKLEMIPPISIWVILPLSHYEHDVVIPIITNKDFLSQTKNYRDILRDIMNYKLSFSCGY